MKKRILAIVLSLIIVIGLMPSVVFAEGEADSSETVVAKIDNTEYTSLDNAIDAVATVGGTINLTADAIIGKTHTISGDVTIDGKNHIITYADSFAGGLFTVDQGATLTVKNVTIDGGYEGSLDFVNWKNPSIRDNPMSYPLIDDYEAESEYPTKTGSMFTNKGTLHIEESTIQNFISVRNGSQVIIYPSGTGTVTTLSNSTVQNCISGQSGVLYYNYNSASDAKLTIDGCVINENYGWTRGSLIVSRAANFTLSIEDTEITKNGAGGTSYAMILAESGSGSSVTLTRCQISENIGTYGIVETKGTFTMEETTVENNSASSYSVYLYGDKININSGTIKEDKPVDFIIDATIGADATIEAEISAGGNIYNNGTIIGDITLDEGKYIDNCETGKVYGNIYGSVKVGDTLITPAKDDAGNYEPLTVTSDGKIVIPADSTVQFGNEPPIYMENGGTIERTNGGEVTLYLYTVTLNANGGTVSPDSIGIGVDKILHSLPTPTKSGYIFDGWYNAITGGNKVNVGAEISADTTLYARWIAFIASIEKTSTVGKVDTYTITYGDGSTSTFTITNGTDGATGAEGKKVELQVTETHIQWRYVGESEWQDLIALELLKGADGLNGSDGSKGDAGTNGTDGKEVELQVTDSYIQWRHIGDAEWKNLVALANIIGAKGADGKDGVNGTNGDDGADGVDGVTVAAITIGSLALLGNLGWGVFFIGKKKKWF